MLQMLSCKTDASSKGLESMEVAANIHNRWHNMITPDGGKLTVGQAMPLTRYNLC